jgi:hypothetical protein
MKNNIHFWIAHFFLEWKGFQAKVLEKFKTHIVCSITPFFRKLCRLCDNVEKYGTAGQATDDNMAQVHCMLFTSGYKYRMYNRYSFRLQQWFHERASLLLYTSITFIST